MPEYREFLSIEEIAKDYAIRRHREVNHHYNALYPYAFHLQMTVEVANRFLHLIPEDDRPDVIGGCWVHDLIEDARETYNNVKKATNETIAEYSYALANEKGKERSDRANKKYYDEMKAYKHASFIKLCDRIANVTFSINEKSSMINMYRKEFDDFYEKLYDGRFDEMWFYLRNLLGK
jgi:(p)ppGpp synthase/HD superfamily hydrolase